MNEPWHVNAEGAVSHGGGDLIVLILLVVLLAPTSLVSKRRQAGRHGFLDGTVVALRATGRCRHRPYTVALAGALQNPLATNLVSQGRLSQPNDFDGYVYDFDGGG